MPMDATLAAFLAGHRAGAEERHNWGGGDMPLQVQAYLTAVLPPLDWVTSVRSLVFRDDELLVLRNPDGLHIVPGGRREPGEPLEATLAREVLEETGWRIAAPALLGFLHFHHLAPRPAGYAYPHPDFLQVVYRSEALAYEAGARSAGDYEQAAQFVPLAAARALPVSACQRLFLDAALAARGR